MAASMFRKVHLFGFTWVLAWVSAGLPACAGSSGPVPHRVEGNTNADLAADLADAAKLQARLSQMRTQAGRGSAVPFLVAEPKLRRARTLILAGQDPKGVIEDEMQLAANNGERDIATWYASATTLEAFVFPARLLRARDLKVAIVVLRPAQPHERLARPYMVLCAMADPD